MLSQGATEDNNAISIKLSLPRCRLESVKYNVKSCNNTFVVAELLEAAEGNGGFLTVTKGVKATGASFAEVEAVLKEMCKSGYVKMDNDPVTGAVTYHFHEL